MVGERLRTSCSRPAPAGLGSHGGVGGYGGNVYGGYPTVGYGAYYLVVPAVIGGGYGFGGSGGGGS